MKPGLGQERDEWLMGQVAQGHAEMLEPLVRRYATLLMTFIGHMVRDRQKSEDLFQDVFLAVWAKRAQYRFSRPFKPWLYKIAVNRVREVFRRRVLVWSGTNDNLVLPDPPAREALPSDAMIATESATMVRQAVRLLPPRQQMVVVMRIWNGLSYSEIAEAMDLREVTIRSAMHDALISIRRHLEARM